MHRIMPLPFKPPRLDGLSERLLASHYENNYGGAVRRLNAIERRLDGKRFVRVHRSYIVNLDFVQAIMPLESGDARAVLSTGGEVPVSRRYRDALKSIC